MKETRTVKVVGDQIPAELIEWMAKQIAEKLMKEKTHETARRSPCRR